MLNFYTRRFILSKEKINCFKAKKGLSDNARDIQIKALQTGFENGLERVEKEETARLKTCSGKDFEITIVEKYAIPTIL